MFKLFEKQTNSKSHREAKPAITINHKGRISIKSKVYRELLKTLHLF